MSVTDQSAAAKAPYTARLAKAIRLTPQFANRLCSRLETAHAMPDGVSGVLFGTSDEDVIVVQAFRSLMDSEIAAVEAGQSTFEDAVQEAAKAAENDPALASLDLIGWYSFRPLGGLQEGDIAFHNRQLPSVPEMALIIRRAEAGSLLFEFYANGREGVLTETDHRWGASRFLPSLPVSGPVEVALRDRAEEAPPFDEAGPEADRQRDSERLNRFSLSQLWQDQRDETAASSKKKKGSVINPGDVASVPALYTPPKQGGIPWFSSAILFALAAGGTFAILLVRGLPAQTSGSFWRAILPDTGLNLRIEGQGDRVLLSWNRRNSVVRSATGAVLHIYDGSRQRDVMLDAAQVENGAVLYRPTSDDVGFRLEVHGQDGAIAADNLRVLDSKGPSAPATDLAASNTAESSERAPATVPVSETHDWRPAPITSRVDVPQPLPRLETPAPSPHRFDISRLTEPAIPNANSPAPVIPAATPPAGAQTAAPPATHAAQTTPADNVPRPQQTGAAEPLPAHTADSTQMADNRHEVFTTQTTPSQTTPAQSTPPAYTRPATPALQNPAGQLPANNSGLTQPTAPAPMPDLGRYIPPRPIKQVLPDISDVSPSVISSTPEVNVIVTVDKNGRVTHAQVGQRGRKKAAKAMVAAAETAAKQWVFEPAKLDGHTVASEHSIVFQFGGR